MEEIKEGDVVQLKSGGSLMTVYNIFSNREWAKCIWFDSNGEVQEKSFSIITLRLHT